MNLVIIFFLPFSIKDWQLSKNPVFEMEFYIFKVFFLNCDGFYSGLMHWDE